MTIERPTVIVDPARVRRNIARMAEKARASGVRLRPHFKTHQCAAIGEWFREAGIDAITVSSLGMARYFVDAGWDDVTVAFPLNVRELSIVNALAPRARLGLLVDHADALHALARGLDGPADRVRVWIKVDVGYGRAGIAFDDADRIVALARAVVASGVVFAGILTHAGHAYRTDGVEAIREVHAETVRRMNAVADALAAAGIDGAISIGDTPSCAAVTRFANVDEVRPGNFVFFDVMQWRFGVCAPDDIAVALACPVVGVHPDRGRAILYGGAVHASKESVIDARGRAVFGYLALPAAEGPGLGSLVEEAPVVSLSQEHAQLEAPPEILRNLAIGDVVRVFPAHSCLTCDVHRYYLTTEGERLPRYMRADD